MACSMRAATSARLPAPTSHKLRSAATRRPAVASAKRVAPRGAGASLRCRAAAGDGGDDDEDTQTVVLTGKLGQNVRQGMDGWNTRVQVQKAAENEAAQVAVEGDEVTVSFVVKTEAGEVVAASADNEEPLTFEVGTQQFMGNPLFQGIDEAVRGLAVGQSALVQASGGEYDPDLLFQVPKEHPEIVRLAEEYAAMGGIQEGTAVKLMNDATALVVKVTEETVMLDTNHPLAGAPLTLDITVDKVDKLQKAADE